MSKTLSTEHALFSFLRDVGEWYLSPDETLQLKIHPSGQELMKRSNVIYAFLGGNEVRYIGKTSRTANERFIGYRFPGTSQQTNDRVNKEIQKLLKENTEVRIFISEFPHQLQWDGFPINLAAGLEDALIREFQPPLNRLGRDAPRSETQILEIESTASEASEDEMYDDASSQDDGRNFELALTADHVYVNGFINLRKATSKKLGSHDDPIKLCLQLGGKTKEVSSRINRTANRNGSIRIIGNNREIAQLFQKVERGTVLSGTVIDQNTIQLTDSAKKPL